MRLATADGQNGLHGPFASADFGAGQAGGDALSGNVRPRAKSAVYLSRSRARMTVLADHRAPLGVSTWRAFKSAALQHGRSFWRKIS
jgi:hypothetical protein